MPRRTQTRASGQPYRVGVSGWTYADWRGSFYPQGLPRHRELEYASRQVNTIEINGTFYSLQRPSVYQGWYEQTPPGFLFAVKGSRIITHLRRLRDARAPLANFFRSGILLLAEKLGPILWQLPPSLRYDHPRLQEFFGLLPRDTFEAAKLAGLEPLRQRRPLVHAIEVRNPSFCVPAFTELLRRHHIALVIADTAGRFPLIEEVTANLVYVRLHGAEELYASAYSDPELQAWAEKIRTFSRQGKLPAFVYFDNSMRARAPFDAVALQRLLTHLEPAVEMPRRPPKVA